MRAPHLAVWRSRRAQANGEPEQRPPGRHRQAAQPRQQPGVLSGTRRLGRSDARHDHVVDSAGRVTKPCLRDQPTERAPVDRHRAAAHLDTQRVEPRQQRRESVDARIGDQRCLVRVGERIAERGQGIRGADDAGQHDETPWPAAETADAAADGAHRRERRLGIKARLRVCENGRHAPRQTTVNDKHGATVVGRAPRLFDAACGGNYAPGIGSSALPP